MGSLLFTRVTSPGKQTITAQCLFLFDVFHLGCVQGGGLKVKMCSQPPMSHLGLAQLAATVKSESDGEASEDGYKPCASMSVQIASSRLLMSHVVSSFLFLNLSIFFDGPCDQKADIEYQLPRHNMFRITTLLKFLFISLLMVGGGSSAQLADSAHVKRSQLEPRNPRLFL